MLVSRFHELRALSGLLTSADDGRHESIVVRGEPGVGKTVLLRALSDTAAARGFLVVAAVGNEFAQHLPFAALAELLSSLRHSSGASLSFGQAQALRSGLDGEHGDVAPTLVYAAAHSLLTSTAAKQRLLVLVDDAHWLDSASLGGLAFVLRHLHRDAVAVAIAERTGLATELERCTSLPTMEVRGLGVEAARVVLGRGREVSERVAQQCVDFTLGNPMALEELAALLSPEQLAGHETLPEPLPVVGRSLLPAIGSVTEMRHELEMWLGVAAAEDTGDLELIRQASRALQVRGDGTNEAEDLGLLRVVNGRAQWVHPLYRSAAYYRLRPSDRRRVHRALAEHVTDPQRRIWHLSSAALGRDDGLAMEMAGVGTEAMKRGALDLAGQAFERAAELAQSSSQQLRHLSDAGRCYLRVGSLVKARDALERGRSLASWPPPGNLMVMLVQAELWRSGPAVASALAVRHGRSLPIADPNRVMLLSLAAAAEMLGGRVGHVRDLAREAETLGSEHLNPIINLVRDSVLACGLSHCGERAASDRILSTLRESMAAGIQLAPEEIEHLVFFVASADMSAERYDIAESQLRTLLEIGHSRGFEAGFAAVLLADILWRTGRWSECSAVARDVAQQTEATDLVAQAFLAKAMLARSEAGFGFSDEAQRTAEAALSYGEAFTSGVITSWSLAAQGFDALARGSPLEAIEKFRRVADDVRGWGCREPGSIWWQGDYIEALLQHSVPAALLELDELDVLAAETNSRWARAVSLRCRSLLPGKDPRRRFADLEEAAELFASMPAPFERYRTLLEFGKALHRDQGEHAGRPYLLESLQGFQALGARPWSDRTRVLLTSTGSPTANGTPALRVVLSDAELRVALAVGEGLTNKAVAESLYISVKTVEFHLQNIFRKLEMHKRSELIARVVRGENLAG